MIFKIPPLVLIFSQQYDMVQSSNLMKDGNELKIKIKIKGHNMMMDGGGEGSCMM